MKLMFKSALLGLSVAVLVATQVAAEPLTLRYSDFGPPRGPRAESMKWWAAEIAKRTKGQVKIKFYWSQSLVKAKATLKAVGSDFADMGSVIGIYTPASVPIWNYGNAPFGVQDPWVGMKTWQELRATLPELRQETEKLGVHILMNFTTGPVDLLTKKPVTSTADLKGMKIRSSGGWTPLLKNLGAIPVKIGFGEVYQALDRGTIDGTIDYIPYIKSYKHYEVAGNVTQVSMGQVLGYGTGINTKVWAKMSDATRKIITQVSNKFIDVYAKNYLDSVQAAKDALMAGIDGKKVQFHTLKAGEIKIWKEKSAFYTKDWLKKVAAKGIDGEKIIVAFKKIRTKYQNELKTKGYPWTR